MSDDKEAYGRKYLGRERFHVGNFDIQGKKETECETYPHDDFAPQWGTAPCDEEGGKSYENKCEYQPDFPKEWKEKR
ncbi:MAG: hypothetical protein EXS51_01085 [Candidatus Taylorbacteria bacterium]|nr:hypothetical protein [Candidatus Taylorbacteria bacterium]